MNYFTLLGDYLLALLDFMIHIDRHLIFLAVQYGHWVYSVLFLIVFCETGLVVALFLPGDSLLFVTGALAAAGYLSIGIIIPLLLIAAVLGDATNYGLGFLLSKRLLQHERLPWVRSDHLAMTQRFYAQHGGKSLIFARFIPILRTIAPFVAGIGQMDYLHFSYYNIVGAGLWVLSFTCLGYFLGNLSIVKDNLPHLMLLIVVVSLLLVLANRWLSQRKVSHELD